MGIEGVAEWMFLVFLKWYNIYFTVVFHEDGERISK